MAKYLWACYSAFVAVLVGLVFYAQAADGDVYTCQNCYDRVLDCVTNGGANCSSCTNCVKLSPLDCSNMVANVRHSADSIELEVYNLEDYASRQIQFLDESESTLNSLTSSLYVIITSLDNFNPTNDVITPLNLAKRQATLLYNRVINVDSEGNTTSTIVYSNTVTHARVDMSGYQAVGARAKSILTHINNAYDAYVGVETSVIETHWQVREEVDNALSLVSSLVGSLSSIRDASEQIRASSTAIHTEVFNLQAEMDSVNCEPCGKGSGSSGGGSSGGGGVDFTGAEAKLEEIRALLQRLYDLVYNFYNDYDYARVSPAPHEVPTYQSYSGLGNNWFQRVEYLLYSVSPLVPSNTLEGAENPSEIEGKEEFESNLDDVESSINEQTYTLDSKVGQPLSSLKSSFDRFLEKLSVFKSDQLSDGGVNWSRLTILEYGDPSTTGFRLEAVNETAAVLSVFEKTNMAFRILWFLLVLALYIYLVIFVVKFNIKVAVFLLKLLNTSFGSN